jgi:hypothetical protein
LVELELAGKFCGNGMVVAGVGGKDGVFVAVEPEVVAGIAGDGAEEMEKFVPFEIFE